MQEEKDKKPAKSRRMNKYARFAASESDAAEMGFNGLDGMVEIINK